MEKTAQIARYLLALFLLVFGLNKFIGFMPMNMPEGAAQTYFAGLATVNMLPILGVIYILSAIALATDKLVGLATVILAAIVFNILIFHIQVFPAGILPGLIFAILLVLVMIGNKSKYQGLLDGQQEQGQAASRTTAASQ